jgi:hypothetical protein
MQSKATIVQRKFGSEYLTSIRSLSDELACATAAIARNDIEALENHIASQQELCDQLLSLDKFRHYLRETPTAWSSLREALRTLIRNNQVYSKLLTHSGRSHQVLLTLCKTYKGSWKQVAGQDPNTRTLSCEG